MKKIILFILGIVFILSLERCKKDTLLTSALKDLSFSKDTLLFDTVFTTVGSMTKMLKIYNRSNQTITIESVILAGGPKSPFKINVDGVKGPVVPNIKLRKNDSLFIFVEVTIDPTNSNNPFVISDSLLININGQSKNAKLVAWGQNAIYHTANAYGAYLDENNDTVKIFYHSISCNSTWNNDRPHVVYGYAIVEPTCQLTIVPGTKVHFYKNSGLIVGNPFINFAGASLKAIGTNAQPIVFQGSRLEFDYRNVPGQWDRIWFTPYSQDNELSYVKIMNGNIGVQADTNINANPTVIIKNSIIQNHAGIGVLGQGARIEMENTLVANCGQYLCAMAYGGKYNFLNCTFANFWDYGAREEPSLLLNNYYKIAENNYQSRPLEQANFINCIIYGTNEEEIGLDQKNIGAFNYVFDHCILKTKLNTSDGSKYINVIANPAKITEAGESVDPIFKKPINLDFSLREGSVAIDKGNASFAPPTDITDKVRTNPDIGAYEY